MSAKHEPESTQHADVLTSATVEATKPGADTESQYECPFCVMMRKGGCEEVFKAFMDCGEKADKGNSEMADCLPQFEQLHLCMEKNKAVFDSLLQEMKDEEELNKAAAGASSSDVSAVNDSTAAVAQHVGSDQGVPAGMPTQQQEQHVADGSRPSKQNGGVEGGAHAVQHDAVPSAAGSMAGAG